MSLVKSIYWQDKEKLITADAFKKSAARVFGEKIRDDPKLIKKAIKKKDQVPMIRPI